MSHGKTSDFVSFPLLGFTLVIKLRNFDFESHNFFFFFFFITNKLSLQLEALSNCDNFTVITILYNNDVLTWDYKDNNKYQVTMS